MFVRPTSAVRPTTPIPKPEMVLKLYHTESECIENIEKETQLFAAHDDQGVKIGSLQNAEGVVPDSSGVRFWLFRPTSGYE